MSRWLRDLSGNAARPPNGPSSYGYLYTPVVYVDNFTHLPSPERATVVGNQLTLTFSAPMKGGSVPPASAFTVKVNGNPASLAGANPIAVSGRDRHADPGRGGGGRRHRNGEL